MKNNLSFVKYIPTVNVYFIKIVSIFSEKYGNGGVNFLLNIVHMRVVPKVMSNNFCKVTCFIIDKPNTPP